MEATKNVESGNKELSKAIERNSSSRTFLLLFLFVMTFSILFLDWYKWRVKADMIAQRKISLSSSCSFWLYMISRVKWKTEGVLLPRIVIIVNSLTVFHTVSLSDLCNVIYSSSLYSCTPGDVIATYWLERLVLSKWENGVHIRSSTNLKEILNCLGNLLGFLDERSHLECMVSGHGDLLLS